MAGLLVESARPAEVARFWGRALAGEVRTLLDGSARVRGDFPELTFYTRPAQDRQEPRHLDVYVHAAEPPLAWGARLLDDYEPTGVTLADVEGNEFCAFITPGEAHSPPARVFAGCSDRAGRASGGVVGPRDEQRPGWHATLARWVTRVVEPDLKVCPGRRPTRGAEPVEVDRSR